jgi:hypothetical protein
MKIKEFLCNVKGNAYDIKFLSFNIRDYGTKEILFDTSGDSTKTMGTFEFDYDHDSLTEDEMFRKIKYTFSERVLKLPLIATT